MFLCSAMRHEAGRMNERAFPAAFAFIGFRLLADPLRAQLRDHNSLAHTPRKSRDILDGRELLPTTFLKFLIHGTTCRAACRSEEISTRFLRREMEYSAVTDSSILRCRRLLRVIHWTHCFVTFRRFSKLE